MNALSSAQLKYLHRNSPPVNGIMPLAAFLKAAQIVHQALGLIEPPELAGKQRHEGLQLVVDQAADALQLVSDATTWLREIPSDVSMPLSLDAIEKAVTTLTTYIAITHRVMEKTPAAVISAAAINVETSALLPRKYVADVDVQTVGAAND